MGMFKIEFKSQWLRPIISDTGEAEIGGPEFEVSLSKKLLARLYHKEQGRHCGTHL
jgi:hypothetical protein